ncbi:hypothetical protein NM04_14895 [Massilia aurea]|uniref:Peptidase S24/S26A/S26B/S26C domain-containing protein n=1 Tax=Massilia aurea TaxID=373040 RepID=A0A422QJ95_9BURK|nr:S24 family peptidase [Massilia aurea]RNF30026.1 hypothetical protein NM04_14895 [Massilia aurea]
MNSKAKRNSEKKSSGDRPIAVEEYARLVERLNEADIEAACSQDGADAGGVPPAWSTPRPMDKLREHREEPSVLSAPTHLYFEWERAQASRIVARGESLAAIGVHDGDEFHIDEDAELNDGDLVAAEGSGGRLLRRLRHVGGARLLCSGSPDLPAIALDNDFHSVGVVSLANYG